MTENFKIGEFTRTSLSQFQDKNKNEVGPYLGNILKVCTELEKLRVFVFRPVIIYSGFRCKELNEAVGGAPTSQHLTGCAADFSVKDFEDITGLTFIYNWCFRHLDYGQLILEEKKDRKPWIHIGLPREGVERTAFIYRNGKYTPFND
jgi:hypothetical protein